MKFNLNAESSETLTPAEVKEMFETIIETAQAHFGDVLDSDSDHDPEWKEYARKALSIKFTIEEKHLQGETYLERKERERLEAEYFAGVNKRLDAIDKTAGS